MKYAPLACALLLFASCTLPTVDVMPRYGKLDVEGDVGADVSGMSVLQNDVSELGIDDDDGFFGARVDLDVGAPHFVFMGQRTEHDGDGMLSQDITIDGTTLSAGTTVDTDFDLGLYSALALFDVIPTEVVDFGLGVGISAVDLDMTVQDTMSANSVSTDETLPFPVLAAHIGTEITDRLELAGLISGFAIDIDDADIRYLDADAFLRFALFGAGSRGRGSLVLGYRWTDLDIEYEDDSDIVDAELNFAGPYLGLELHF